MRALVAAAVVVMIAGVAQAQFRRGTIGLRKNISYDGRFTFVRLNYTTAPGGYFYRGEPAGRMDIRWPSRTSWQS